MRSWHMSNAEKKDEDALAAYIASLLFLLPFPLLAYPAWPKAVRTAAPKMTSICLCGMRPRRPMRIKGRIGA